MNIVLITGSSGLVGSEAVSYFIQKNFSVVGIDNNMRRYFFGEEGSTFSNLRMLQRISKFKHHNFDIRDYRRLEDLFREYTKDIKLVIHAAAQPSHDWAAKEPLTDFSVNATGTLNLLELTRKYCPHAVFIFVSTNKVYGDSPNKLPFIEQPSRWELALRHPFYDGIDESMTIDQSKHSLFGASKLAADILAQEYGRYFGIRSGIFRAGCLTGAQHAGVSLHGFLSYLMKCVVSGKTYTIIGYKGKQVRDNLHAADLARAFHCFYQNPRRGEVYNMGGGREQGCSILEAIKLCEEIAGKKLKVRYSPRHREGDHQWYISSLKKFRAHYPQWQAQYNLREILGEIYNKNCVKKKF